MRKKDTPESKAHMVTTTLYLRPDQWEWLMQIKQETDAPVAAVIRRAIDAAMGKKS
jgi:hypothetical protein